MDTYTEIARLLGPRAPSKPWIWSVIPKTAHDAAVGLGISDNEDRARKAVEEIMTDYPATAAFGALEGPTTRERCLRNSNGGFTWLPCR